ncbi:histidine kinase dimerization/phosphoacceptor domain -containing protein [Bosea sp. 117]|uniref:sensor histidine kinase n=1 Tax=Bosea sp. 117 TaxID=1125973 RepID=UPI000691E248|nr:histidine kinase dimerization/phosphoacceptor domain -containing protein [Bosea sp. 117]
MTIAIRERAIRAGTVGGACVSMAEGHSRPRADSVFWRLNGMARPLRRHPFLGDLAGLGLLLLAFLTRLAIDPALPPGFPFITFFPVVVLATFLGGLRPGIVCALLGAAVSWAFFIGPANGMRFDGPSALAIVFFLFVSAIDIALVHFSIRALDLLEQEKELSAQLYEQQRTLFQELQHRVANSMQFVAGLLALHKRRASETAVDPGLVIDAARVRIETIARIHRRLYDPQRLNLPTAQYLSELCADLIATSGTSVSCDVRAPNLTLNMAQLTTLSLLVAEIVTNSLKHAFTAQMQGRIGIVIEALPERRYRVTVADNGRGVPAGFDPASGNSLGFRIIQALAMQLGGTVKYSGGGGTRVEIEFALA